MAIIFPKFDLETRLADDVDGSYKAQLISLLESHQDEFASARQGFLPSDAYEVATRMEKAMQAASSFIRDYEPVFDREEDAAAMNNSADGIWNTRINV